MSEFSGDGVGVRGERSAGERSPREDVTVPDLGGANASASPRGGRAASVKDGKELTLEDAFRTRTLIPNRRTIHNAIASAKRVLVSENSFLLQYA